MQESGRPHQNIGDPRGGEVIDIDEVLGALDSAMELADVKYGKKDERVLRNLDIAKYLVIKNVESEAKYTSLMQALTALQKSIQESVQEIARFGGNLSNREEKLAAREARVNETEKNLATLISKGLGIDEREKQMTETTKLLNQKEQHISEMAKRLADMISKGQGVDEKEKDLAEKEKALLQKEQQLEKARTHLTSLVEKNNASYEAITGSTNKLMNYVENFSIRQREIDEKNSDLTRRQAALTTWKTNLEEREKKVLEKENEQHNLEKRKTELENKITELEKGKSKALEEKERKVESREEELVKKEKELNSFSKIVAERNERLIDRKMILDNRENEIKKMEDELEKFKVQLAKKDDIITRLNEKIETLRTLEGDLKETVARLRVSI